MPSSAATDELTAAERRLAQLRARQERLDARLATQKRGDVGGPLVCALVEPCGATATAAHGIGGTAVAAAQ